MTANTPPSPAMESREPSDAPISTSERFFALREAHHIAAEHGYFDARPQIDTNDNRNVFKAGFERGFGARDTLALTATRQSAPTAAPQQLASSDPEGHRQAIADYEAIQAPTAAPASAQASEPSDADRKHFTEWFDRRDGIKNACTAYQEGYKRGKQLGDPESNKWWFDQGKQVAAQAPQASPAKRGTEPSDERIAELRSQYGVTSNGRGIKEWTQVLDFARALLAESAPSEKLAGAVSRRIDDAAEALSKVLAFVKMPAYEAEVSRALSGLRAVQANASHAETVPQSPARQGVQLARSRRGRVYLAGPMTGIPEFNFPAFNEAAASLRAKGLHVENPAEHGIVDGASWADYLHYDVTRLATCEAVFLLPDWSKSKGAALEVSIARALGMGINYIEGAERASMQAEAPQAVPAAAQDEALRILRVLLPIVEQLEDEGPLGAGWKSGKLDKAISDAHAFIAARQQESAR